MSLYDTFHADRVEAKGKVVGLSTWTGYSANERAILSLGTIDAELAAPGTEVTIVWGEDKPSPKAQVEDHEVVVPVERPGEAGRQPAEDAADQSDELRNRPLPRPMPARDRSPPPHGISAAS